MQAQIERFLDDFERGALSRRGLIAQLAALFGAMSLASRGRAADGGETPTFQATAINHVALRVTDVARSREFYRRHLGLSVHSDGDRSSFLGCGPDFLALFRAETPAMDHYCYTVKGYDPADAVKRLEAAGLEARRRGDRVYFDDPDGLEVQVSAPNRET